MNISLLIICLLLVLNLSTIYLIRTKKESWNQLDENPIVKSGSTCVGPGSNSNAEALVNDCCENANVDSESDPKVKISQLKACKKCLKKPKGWYSNKNARFTGNGICFREQVNFIIIWVVGFNFCFYKRQMGY